MLNQALKTIRKFDDVTINELSQRSGLSISYISEIENGRKNINENILNIYSQEFEIDVSDIFLISNAISKKGSSNSNKIANILRWISDL